MGPQRVLQAALVVAAVARAADAAPGDKLHERVAVIDLGPADDGAIRRRLSTGVVDAGLDPVIGDGVEDALAGLDTPRDDAQLASALERASRAFGALDCKAAVAESATAIGVAAARQAGGLPAPELPRAWTYQLLCADRAGDTDAAMLAAHRLRLLGAIDQVPEAMRAKYPDVDAMIDRETLEVDIASEPGAAIWIDFARAGTAPLHATLPAGHHVIAAALGTKRGWAAGTTDRKQRAIAIELTETAGTWSDVARRVAGWQGQVPPPAELAVVLGRVRARVALIRHGDRVEAWGQLGRAEAPRPMGGDDGTGALAESGRVLAAVVDRVHGWNDHAPDPDRPLLVESADDRRAASREREKNPPTKWWVYASIAGAVVAAATIVYVHDAGSDTQHVVLRFP